MLGLRVWLVQTSYTTIDTTNSVFQRLEAPSTQQHYQLPTYHTATSSGFNVTACRHIDISDDAIHFPPCWCRRVRGTRHLKRACGACIRYSSPAFVVEREKAIELQLYRFRSLMLSITETEKYVPQWRKIVGLGTEMLRDGPDQKELVYINDDAEGEILDALEDEMTAVAGESAEVATTTGTKPAHK
ncbi:hypothetical protein TWF730_003664 [Orbilia blumenaviensis]|uniref:Uncharacterized protein n=1 Tax=Orbilia blumenaviensis TaxID=1796055 RepID=A0AAV9U4A6_9PEZI